MPVTKQARKKLRKDLRREEKNKEIKSNLSKTLKSTRKNPTLKNLSIVVKAIDKASKKNIIHNNKAARLKSRLAKLSKSRGTLSSYPSKKKK